MKNKYQEQIQRVNCLTNDLNGLYHQAALNLGLSDSSLFVLYMLYNKGDNCLLNDICKESGISKQTINSALRKLESDGILYLEQDKGKTKRVRLTEKGKNYILQTGARLLEAECHAFDDWSDTEVEQYLNLMEKYNASFRVQIDNWFGGQQ